MAIYHLSAQIIKRSEGRSAIVAAAYRAGERLSDRETGMVADYRNKGGIVHTEIRTPAGAPAWMRDRETLWNVLEYRNRRRDAQLAREMNIALPRELPFEQQKALLRRFVDEQFVERGMVADMAIHHDPENNNPHAHVMLSFYAANQNGFLRTRTREWNSKDFLNETRAAWSDYANRAMEAMGVEERIDHRTLAAQGIDRRPTIHEGPNNRKAWDKGHRPASNVVDIQTYAGRRRELHYPEIDAGRTRAQHNAHIHQFNERQVGRRIGEAMDAIDGWMRHRFLEASVKRNGVRLRDARRARRSAEGSIKFWSKVLKTRRHASMLSRVFENKPRRLARIVQQIGIAERRLKDAKRRQAIARQQELTAERDFRSAKLSLGRDRQERKERRQRSTARWVAAVGRVAPEDIRLDRLPRQRHDPRWQQIVGWLSKAHAARQSPTVRDRGAARAQEQEQVQVGTVPRVEAEQPRDTEGLARLHARVVRLERMVRLGQASIGELERARRQHAERASQSPSSSLWKRPLSQQPQPERPNETIWKRQITSTPRQTQTQRQEITRSLDELEIDDE